MVTASGSSVLIDVTRDAATQLPRASRCDLVLVTHPHRDASGGIPVLDRWLAGRTRHPVPLWTAGRTVRVLRARHPRIAHLELRAIASHRSVRWRGWTITPIAVPHARDCTSYAWRLAVGGRSIVYASDVSRLTPALGRVADGCDLLILDGATWRRSIFTHLRLDMAAPIVATWRVGRVLFTQLGRSTPAHARLDAWLARRAAHLGAAYDGLIVRM